MSARPIACALILLATTLAGCGATTDVRVGMAAMAPDAGPRAARADRPPVALLDCDGDGGVSFAELAAGFTLTRGAVTAEAFAAADLSRDAKWNEAEFARFLDHRAVRSWTVVRPCPAEAGR